MSKIASTFDHHGRDHLFRPASEAPEPARKVELPWVSIHAAGRPPLMFDLAFRDGAIVSFSYNDIRMIDYRDAGKLQLVVGMDRTRVSIEGRHLAELRAHLSRGMLLSVRESDDDTIYGDEDLPAVERIVVEPSPVGP
tara:strand:+ start:6545 stop:6958 length:414 start_codon:yes stop_codon:yes gene_type:complete